MTNWYATIRDSNTLMELPDFINFFESEYEKAVQEVKLKGNVESLAAKIPGAVQHRVAQLQEIEAVLDNLHRRVAKIKRDKYEDLQKNHNRSMNATELKYFSENSQEVLDMLEIINHVALVRNKYASLTKGFEYAHYQIGHIIKLRTAGMEDAEINVQQWKT